MARRLALSAALVAALAVPAAASTGGPIVVGKSIRGVALDMTQKQVRAVLGTPKKTVRRNNEFGPYTEFTYNGLKVTFQGNATVTGMRTTSRLDRTKDGIGVGSTIAEVKAKVRGVRCESSGGGAPLCSLGRYAPGQLVTAFFTDGQRVTEVIIGYVID